MVVFPQTAECVCVCVCVDKSVRHTHTHTPTHTHSELHKEKNIYIPHYSPVLSRALRWEFCMVERLAVFCMCVVFLWAYTLCNTLQLVSVIRGHCSQCVSLCLCVGLCVCVCVCVCNEFVCVYGFLCVCVGGSVCVCISM